MGTKWCCSGFREPESKVYADPDGEAPGMTDVRQFVEESRLNSLDVGAEMEPVADTFRGVENLNGVFNWECPDGLKPPQNEWRHLKQIENSEKDRTIRAQHVLKDADPEWVHSSAAEGSPQRKRLFSLLWKILPLKTSNNNPVELIEFARDVGNENCTFQPL